MKPYKFVPYLKSTIWGGEQIAPFKGITTDQHTVGESWEISSVPGFESVTAPRGIQDDPDLGLNLTQLIDKYGAALVGEQVYVQFGCQFPLLIKFIDAKQDLSVQVHPDDQLAQQRHGCAGKTEMWYIMQAAEGAKIYAGLNQTITPEQYEQLANAETINGHSPMQDVIATHDAHAGDIFFLPAGRLHAIGAGNLLAEIQQTSDITYRVYDFGRKDANGNTRELHVQQAKDAIDYTVYPDYRATYDPTQTNAELVQCPYFKVNRIVVEQQAQIDLHTNSFVVIICLEGQADVNGVPMHQGETLLVPADANTLTINGSTTILTATI